MSFNNTYYSINFVFIPIIIALLLLCLYWKLFDTYPHQRAADLKMFTISAVHVFWGTTFSDDDIYRDWSPKTSNNSLYKIVRFLLKINSNYRNVFDFSTFTFNRLEDLFFVFAHQRHLNELSIKNDIFIFCWVFVWKKYVYVLNTIDCSINCKSTLYYYFSFRKI